METLKTLHPEEIYVVTTVAHNDDAGQPGRLVFMDTWGGWYGSKEEAEKVAAAQPGRRALRAQELSEANKSDLLMLKPMLRI